MRVDRPRAVREETDSVTLSLGVYNPRTGRASITRTAVLPKSVAKNLAALDLNVYLVRPRKLRNAMRSESASSEDKSGSSKGQG